VPDPSHAFACVGACASSLSISTKTSLSPTHTVGVWTGPFTRFRVCRIFCSVRSAILADHGPISCTLFQRLLTEIECVDWFPDTRAKRVWTGPSHALACVGFLCRSSVFNEQPYFVRLSANFEGQSVYPTKKPL